MEFTSTEIISPSARLFVKDYGGEDSIVILLHGGPGVPDYLEPVAEILLSAVDNSLHVISFDQRGVGKSTSLNGRYNIQDYLDDLESIRSYYNANKIHLFGHSWGGLLAELYANSYSHRVSSMFLCNSALGIGLDWKRNESEVMEHNRRQSGSAGFVAFGLLWALGALPNRIGHYAFKKVMQRVWSNYFMDPNKAPLPDKQWMNGVNRRAFIETSKSVGQTSEKTTFHNQNTKTLYPLTILYGGYDIYGSGTQVVYSRFPNAQKILLENSGHIPWLQDKERFTDILRQFYHS